MSGECAQAADDETEKADSFVRWQKYTIDQLTYAIGLILTLTTASLGFAYLS